MSREEMKTAWDETATELQNAMRVAPGEYSCVCRGTAAERMDDFSCRWGVDGSDRKSAGERRVLRPGGRYPLPSTLLMTVSPAQVLEWRES